MFYESLQQRKLPKTWKLAKIIPFKKLGKANITKPSIFHPISSLLLMLPKGIEVIVTKRLIYLAEKFNLLSTNYYKALKRKSTIDAFLII